MQVPYVMHVMHVMEAMYVVQVIMVKYKSVNQALFQKSEIEKSKDAKNGGSKVNCAGDGQYDSPGKTDFSL